MKTHIYSNIEDKTIEDIRSKAETPVGRAKAIVKHGKLVKLGAAKIAQPWLLDRLAVGAPCELNADTVYNYRFRSLTDLKIRDEASKIIGNHGQRSNYGPGAPRIYGPAYQTRWETINYKGAFKGYRGSFLYQEYQSCIGISRSGRTALLIQRAKLVRRIIAPKGMQFDRDDNGILLRRLSDKMDYHPTLENWKSKRFATEVREGMAANFSKRQAAVKLAREGAREKKIKAREIGSVRVTLADSRRAGNCVEGSLAWCERKLHISREVILSNDYLFSVPASKILATEDSAALRAVDTAWQRETTVSI